MPSLTCHIILEIQNSRAVQAEVQREKNAARESKNLGGEASPVAAPVEGVGGRRRGKLPLPVRLGRASATLLSGLCSGLKRALGYAVIFKPLTLFFLTRQSIRGCSGEERPSSPAPGWGLLGRRRGTAPRHTRHCSWHVYIYIQLTACSSFLLSSASPSLPQNGTRLKAAGDAVPTRRAGLGEIKDFEKVGLQMRVW